MKRNWLILFFLSVMGFVPVRAQSNACDVNTDGSVNVVDVQLVTNMYLGTTPCTANIAGLNTCTPTVVQTVVNTALGGTCFLHYVLLTWTASPSSGIAGYNVYRSSSAGGPYTKMNSALITTSFTFSDTTSQAGQTYYYVATAVSTSNAESAYSTPISATVPTP